MRKEIRERAGYDVAEAAITCGLSVDAVASGRLMRRVSGSVGERRGGGADSRTPVQERCRGGGVDTLEGVGGLESSSRGVRAARIVRLRLAPRVARARGG